MRTYAPHASPSRALASILSRAFRNPARRVFHAFSSPSRRNRVFARARGALRAHLSPIPHPRVHLTSFPPSRPRASQGLTPYERERAEKIARNAAQMKALGLPALGGIVGAAPSSAGGFTPVRRKNPIATPEPAAPFRIILRERPAKPVNYNVDAFDSEDEEEARERKRARRAETARAGGKPRKRPTAAKDDDDRSDYEVESGDEDDDDALGSASDSETDSDDEVDPDPPSEEFLLYGGSLAKKYEVPEHRARANRTAAMYTNGTNWLEESKLNFRACRDRAKERRLAKEQAAREKQERKLQRRKEKDEGAGAMVVVPGDAPETDDVDVNGKKIHRKGFHTVQGVEGKHRGTGGENGVTTCAKCKINMSSKWHKNNDPAIPGEKICESCYRRAKVRARQFDPRVLHPPRLTAYLFLAQVGDGYVCPGCKSTDASDWSNAKGHLVCHDDQLVEKGVKICTKCSKKEVRTRVVCPVRPHR